MAHHAPNLSFSSVAPSSGVAPAPRPRDAMECALDGVATAEEAAARLAAASQRADQDPELIMLALRGLPVYPSPIVNTGAHAPPEAAFVVSGGPPALLREVLLPPYPLEEAPAQLYAALEQARRLQSSSEFKPAVQLLFLVLRVWRKKHLWKLLREEPSMTLAEALEEDVRRTDQRRLRAIYKEEERIRREEEEAEFARKMAETEEGGGDGHDAVAPAAAAAAEESKAHSDESDSEGDLDDEHEDGRVSTRKGHHGHGHGHGHGEHHAGDHGAGDQDASHSPQQHASSVDEPEEVLEFPEVTPEEELEFLVYYYNALGSVYQSAAAAPSSGGGQRVTSAGGDGTGSVRWGRIKVIPCPADDPVIRDMLCGTKSGAQLGDAGARTGGSNADDASGITSMLAASSLDDDDSSSARDSDPLASDEEFMATSAADLSNNSSLRALIAFWQAKRAHDVYVQIMEADRAREIAIQRASEAAARGVQNNGNNGEEDDTASSTLDDGSGLGPDGKPLGPANAHTTLGQSAFAALNIPGLSLDALQAESKAMGLFGFPAVQQMPSAAPGAAGGRSSSQRDQENSLLFWSTQPILAAPVGKGTSSSNKSLSGLFGSSGSVASLSAPSSSGGRASGNGVGVGGGLPASGLINPYMQCSSADAATYSNLSTTLHHLGNFPLALRAAHVALQIRCATLRPSDDEFVDVATSLNNLGAVLAALQLYPAAHDHFAAAEELLRTRLDPVHPRLALVGQNLTKVRTRRQGMASAPALLQELRNMASGKERKAHDAQEKRMAKAARRGAKAAAAPARKFTPAGKKGEEPPKEFHEDPRYFQKPVEGQPPVVPPPPPPHVEGEPEKPLPPIGTAAAAITQMPLRQFDVQMGNMQKMLLEFGPAKKKAPAADAKGKKGKK